MIITQSPTFYKFVKKIDKNFKSELDNQIKKIAADPLIGEQKQGDLQDIRILKFKFSNTLYLVAYRHFEEKIQLIMINTHENFYRNLKNYIK